MSSVKRTKSQCRFLKIQCRTGHAMNEEQRIELCKTGLTQIYTMLRTNPGEWRAHINLARSIIANLDATTLMQQRSRSQEQIWFIAGLQRLAFADSESNDVPDVVAWCSRQWLAVLERDPQNLTAMRGIGQLWHSRAQPALSRIHRSEGSPSSSNSSNQSSRPRSGGSDSNGSSRSSGEAERRVGMADYVEARGYLQPATEYLDRAVTAAAAQRLTCGELLATTAEAFLSLGHVSSPRTNEQHFRRAVQLLQTASTIPGFVLTRSLRRYLDDYGRYLT